MITLQNLVFPKPGICYETEMYFRYVAIPNSASNGYLFNSQAQLLTVDRGSTVSFDTYFNGLSIGKWKKYTTVTKYALVLDLQGKFSIALMHSQIINGVTVQKVLASRQVGSTERCSIELLFPECESTGAISFRLESLEDGSVLYGGRYCAAEFEQPPRRIGLALNICNFNREAYIYRNMGIIDKYILSNPESELREHLSIFVADNSSTIDTSRLPKGCSYVFPQGDFGGAGGFCRGLMEVQRANTDGRYTHVVMMDDDILIEPDSLERMYAFLCFIREEYRHAFIGGALLRLDFQNIQCTHGGEWDWNAQYVFHKMNANLCSMRDVLLNEVEDGAKINAWWCHCIPITEISLQNLPYPFFFHMDDVEYDLRNCQQVINLNGICVWHEPFENKPGSHLFYYNTRNILIAHMLHFKEMRTTDALNYLRNAFFQHLLIYRYKEAELVARGVEDALRGPKWLVAQNPEGLLEDVLAQGYRKQAMDDLPIRLDYDQYLCASQGLPPETKWHRLVRRCTLNGYLCKANRDAIIPMFGPSARSVYRAKRVLNYDPISERGFITEKSYRDMIHVLCYYWKVRKQIKRRFNSARAEYQKQFPAMTNERFWDAYLGITRETTNYEKTL